MAADEPAASPAVAPAKLDDVMLAMDVVDTLRHRERLVERELDEETREEQLIERLRKLYKSQGIEVPDHVIVQGVKALKESRFVYAPPRPGFRRTIATLWVKRAIYGKWVAVALGSLVAVVAVYRVAVVGPRERAARVARIELTEELPRQLVAAHRIASTEAQVPALRERADAVLARGRAALERGNAADARAALAELDGLARALEQEYVIRIAGRPQDQTGFYREHPGFGGRAYYVVVDAIDPAGKPVRLSIRNDETNKTESVSHFAIRVPPETFEAVRSDKARNGIVQNSSIAEKHRGYLQPEYRMPVMEGRITRW